MFTCTATDSKPESELAQPTSLSPLQVAQPSGSSTPPPSMREGDLMDRQHAALTTTVTSTLPYSTWTVTVLKLCTVAGQIIETMEL